jgi:hypothetical protein
MASEWDFLPAAHPMQWIRTGNGGECRAAATRCPTCLDVVAQYRRERAQPPRIQPLFKKGITGGLRLARASSPLIAPAPGEM